MNFRQFAFNNIVRNKRTYIAHFLSSAFSVMVFFTYALLLFHPNLQGELRSTSGTMSQLGTMGMKISQYLILIFSFLFLMYSVSAFLKMRKREFGILLTLGMSPRQLNKLVFIENMIIGLASIVTGLLVGLIFSKLILLGSAALLYIENGLPFYVPVKAIWTTAGAFICLFLLISLFTAALGKRVQLVELMKSEEKPKPEPQASIWLSLLAVILIGLGYAAVFYFVLARAFLLPLLGAGVGLVVLGTYFLFTQLSVYAIRALKRKDRLFFRKTNLLTISELAYRLKDNSVMFFMVSIISAVSFTGIGTCVAIGSPGLAEMIDPYAFTYASSSDDKLRDQHLTEIQKQLTDAQFPYQMGSVTPKYSKNSLTVVKLTDYNSLLKALGHKPASLSGENDVILAPTNVTQKNMYSKPNGVPSSMQLIQGKMNIKLNVTEALPYIVMPYRGKMIVVTDALYDQMPPDAENASTFRSQTYYFFNVPNWEASKDVSRKLQEAIPDDRDGHYYFNALVITWLMGKQVNGILLIVSVMVGIVFFTFAASFIYFRLYADMERDEKQYQMISKIGLSRAELRKIVTRQLLILFFLPILMALIHSAVAFTALQLLVDFSIVKNSILIFVFFIAVQVVYFLAIRWRYLQQLVRKIA
ncbi:ABC transporter permease [Paenibacillus sp. GCM10027628]|uniref:ABC transporter permease n=1 Tax=Paenibacillus sp. GCM10027628 TaxID=3273413 RepID=UPI0036297B24